jgi:hypothetical protein
MEEAELEIEELYTEQRRAIDRVIAEDGLLNVLWEISRYAGGEAIHQESFGEFRLLKQYWDLSSGLDKLIEQFKAANPNELVPEEFEEEEAA